MREPQSRSGSFLRASTIRDCFFVPAAVYCMSWWGQWGETSRGHIARGVGAISTHMTTRQEPFFTYDGVSWVKCVFHEGHFCSVAEKSTRILEYHQYSTVLMPEPLYGIGAVGQ